MNITVRIDKEFAMKAKAEQVVLEIVMVDGVDGINRVDRINRVNESDKIDKHKKIALS